MAEESNYSWLANMFANLEDPEEDFFSVFGTPEQMDLYSAAVSDDDLLIAAYQFEQAGSLDPIALEATATLEAAASNPYGLPLSVDRLLEIAEEYPALTITGDLLASDQTDLTDAINLSGTPGFKDNAKTIITAADNQGVDLMSAATNPANSTYIDRLAALTATLNTGFDESTFDEGAYISPMATSTFDLDGEPVAGAFGTPDGPTLEELTKEVIEGIKAEDGLTKATTQEQAEKTLGGGEATAATTATVSEAVRKAAMTGEAKGFNTLV